MIINLIAKNRKRLGFIIFSQFLAFALPASDSPQTLINVEIGETVSGILYNLNLKPIYGKRGLLKKTLQLNPYVKKRLDFKIYPGEIIKIPISDEETSNLFGQNSNETKDLNEGDAVSVVPVLAERALADDFKHEFFWKIAPSLSWKALDSTDENVSRQSNIKVLSQTNYGVVATYGMRFEENLDFYSRFFLEFVTFSSDNSISLVRNNILSNSFYFGGMFEKKYGFELGMENQYFLTSSTSQTIEIKKVTLPKVNFSYSQNLYQNKKGSIGAIFSGRVFLPRSSSEFEAKLGVGAGAEFQFKLLNQSLGIGYDYNVLKSETNSTTSQTIFWKYLWENL